jgi:anti-sigma B factor antagonist
LCHAGGVSGCDRPRGEEEERVDFGVATRQAGAYTVVEVTGEFDVYTAPVLEESLGELVDGGQRDIVVDLTGVTFMDSTGLGLLIKALKWTREKDGSLRIVASTEKVLKVFRVTGLDTVLSLHETVDAATEG